MARSHPRPDPQPDHPDPRPADPHPRLQPEADPRAVDDPTREAGLAAAPADVPLIEPLPFEASFEIREPDEDATDRAIRASLASIRRTTFEDEGRELRSVHAKSHGLLRGELQVLALPQPYAQGLFAVPAVHPAVVRLSTSPGDLLDDHVSTPRGFALKVLDVAGERLPGSEADDVQDFVLVDAPAFFAPSAARFLGSLQLLAATTDRAPGLKRALSSVLRGAERVVEAVGGQSGLLTGLGGHPTTHPLGETYFSQVPFLYGPYMAKWSIAPIAPELQALHGEPVDLRDRPDGLRDAIVDWFATRGGAWELRVQLCTDIDRMPIEDASVAWPQDESPFVPVARLVVPAQAAWDADGSAQAEAGLAFSPWHGLALHRPLGAINRVRRTAYAASAQARGATGGCPARRFRRSGRSRGRARRAASSRR